MIRERAIDYESIGRRVYRRRQELGLTQGQVARMVGISTSFIGHIERAEKVPSLETIVNLCQVMEMTLDELVLGVKQRCEGEKCSLYSELNELLQAYALERKA